MNIRATRCVFAFIVSIGLLITVFSSTTLATAYTISGMVKSTVGRPVPYAAIDVYDAGTKAYIVTASSDNSGNYTAYVPSGGEYSVSVFMAGFSAGDMQPILLTDASPAAAGIDIVMSAVIPLSQGWNFISFPRQPLDAAIGAALSPISSKIVIIWAYDNVNQAWLKWKPDLSSSTLNTIISGKGYWIYMKEAASIDISGWDYPNDTPYLAPGWNLVGFAGRDGQAIPTALSTFDGKWSIVWNWENGQWYARHAVIPNLPLPLVDKFHDGKAYWVKIEQGGNTASWDQAPGTIWRFTSQGSPIQGATVSIYALDGTLIYSKQNATGSEGLFFAPAESLPASFILEVMGGTVDGYPFTDYYRRAVTGFSPRETYTANEITTLIAAYMEKNPSRTYAEAAAAVKAYLAIPDSADMKDVIGSVSYSGRFFSSERFSDANGAPTYKDFINALASEIGTGVRRDFSAPLPTGGLLPLFDPARWALDYPAGAEPASILEPERSKKKKGTFDKVINGLWDGIGGVFGLALDVTFAVIEAEEKATAMETLFRIDQNVTEILAQVKDLKETLKNEFVNQQLAFDWNGAQEKLGDAEDCIVNAFDKYKVYLNAKQQRLQGTISQAELDTARDQFRDQMQIVRSYGNMYELIKFYQKMVTTGYDTKSAIEKYADYLATGMSAADSTGDSQNLVYQKLEQQFLKMFFIQPIALLMIKQYKEDADKCSTTCIQNSGCAAGAGGDSCRNTCDITCFNPFRATPIEQMQDELMMGNHSQMGGTAADPVLARQALAFTKAVEKYVVSHTNPDWYIRWMRCDNIMSSYKSSDACQEPEKPFIRSMAAADALIGKLKGLKTVATTGGIQPNQPYGTDGSYNDYGNGGLFIKLIKVERPDWPGLGKIKIGDHRDYGTFDLEGTVREVAGKNPYTDWPTEETGAFTWQVATYHVSYKGFLSIDLGQPAMDGLHPFTESPYFQHTAFYPTGDYSKIRLPSVVMDASLNFSSFNGWILPVRDGYLSQLVDRDWCATVSERNYYIPISLTECDGQNMTCKLRASVASFKSFSPDYDRSKAQQLRYYLFGVSKPNYTMGYSYEGRRHFVVPFQPDAKNYGVKGTAITPTANYIGGNKIYWTYIGDHQIPGWYPFVDVFKFSGGTAWDKDVIGPGDQQKETYLEAHWSYSYPDSADAYGKPMGYLSIMGRNATLEEIDKDVKGWGPTCNAHTGESMIKWHTFKLHWKDGSWR